jgi:hypothetical protein
MNPDICTYVHKLYLGNGSNLLILIQIYYFLVIIIIFNLYYCSHSFLNKIVSQQKKHMNLLAAT